MVQQSFQFPFSAAIYRVNCYVIYPHVSSNKTFSQIGSKNVSKICFLTNHSKQIAVNKKSQNIQNKYSLIIDILVEELFNFFLILSGFLDKFGKSSTI